MEYTVTLRAHSRDELIEQIAQLADSWLADQATPTQTEAIQNPGTEDDQPELPIPEETPAEEPEEPDTPEPEPASEPEQETPAPEPAPVDLETLREQVMAFAEQNGNTKAKELLAEFGKVSQVPEDARNRIYEAAGGTL